MIARALCEGGVQRTTAVIAATAARMSPERFIMPSTAVGRRRSRPPIISAVASAGASLSPEGAIKYRPQEDRCSITDSDDFKQLRELRTLAPAEFKVWADLDSITGKEDGAIPRKFRELIAIAVACTTQCPYCLDAHTKNAKKAGATRQEVAETVFLAAALRAGAAATHGMLAMKLFDRE